MKLRPFDEGDWMGFSGAEPWRQVTDEGSREKHDRAPLIGDLDIAYADGSARPAQVILDSEQCGIYWTGEDSDPAGYWTTLQVKFDNPTHAREWAAMYLSDTMTPADMRTAGFGDLERG